ncbi:winged helix-turn-helix domain-containing protein [Sodalis sp. RH21]|uniref:winged helix-turn-helix domain-containing protein n=1 Tax=unclassified Sodalis (in: enterobacteria) TaxID=2636512 RepID=UPI0039B37738
MINHFKVQYTFGDFILNSTRILFYKDQKISISPKELGVLILLLESAGEVVTKDRLINEVWSGGNVAEESLTRCIYVLRRLLQEGKHNRFIDTVYGKGYRFTLPVTRITPAEKAATGSANAIVAVLPFDMTGHLDTLGLHDSLVQEMSGYASAGLHVLPSSLTLSCRSVQSTLELLEKIRPDYYLTGYELSLGNQPSLRIELIRTHDHFVMHREGISLDAGLTNDRVKNLLRPLILRHIPGLKAARDAAAGPVREPSCAAWLREGRSAFMAYTPDSLNQALGLFQQCRQSIPDDITLLCHLAECYFALGQLGMMELDGALQECGELVDQVLAKAADHPLALAMSGVLHGLNGDYGQAAEMFRQALALSADNPSVNYYYAWHLFIVGEITRALYFARQVDQTLPGAIATQVLMMWLEYCNGNPSAALGIAERQRGAAMSHPVLLSMKAVILCGEGQPRHALELIGHLRHGGERDGIVYFNTLYTRLFSEPAGANSEQVTRIMKQSKHLMPSALLPVILRCQGMRAAKKWYDQLSTSSSTCLMLWRHDPRVKSLYGAQEGE